MTESDDALMLRVAKEEIKRQAAEIAHWKNNHATEVRRARVLKERTDMPLERVRAYEQIGELREEIERLKTRLEVSPEHPYDGIASRDATIKLQDERIAELREPVNARLLAIAHQTAGIIENTSIETGYCCCGDGMHGHASPMICGHSATDQGAYLAGLLYEDAKAAIAAAEAQQAELSSLSDKAASELQADAARYRYIRTHRIGVKWCELYAGGPALDEAIDATMAAGERAYRRFAAGDWS